MRMCTRFTDAGTERDDTGVITRMGTILDTSFVGDEHEAELRDGCWHVTGPVTSTIQAVEIT